MSTAPILIPSDRAIQLALSSRVPCLVTNLNDTANVYLDNDPSVSRDGYDFVLQPGATITWNANEPLYAISDPITRTFQVPTLVNLSYRTADLFDPNAVASQVSAQSASAQRGMELLLQVPPAAPSYAPIDVSRYNTVVVQTRINGSVVKTAGVLTWPSVDPGNTLGSTQRFFVYNGVLSSSWLQYIPVQDCVWLQPTPIIPGTDFQSWWGTAAVLPETFVSDSWFWREPVGNYPSGTVALGAATNVFVPLPQWYGTARVNIVNVGANAITNIQVQVMDSLGVWNSTSRYATPTVGLAAGASLTVNVDSMGAPTRLLLFSTAGSSAIVNVEYSDPTRMGH